MSTCPSCGAAAAAGSRWCGICHTNVVNPAVGRLASPARRLAAHFCDVAIPIFALFTMLGVVGAGAMSGSDSGAGVGALTAVVLMVVYVVWALRLFARGMTPGKKMLGIRVIKESGAAAGFGTMLVREWIGKWISALVLSLGFLWILIDRDRQGWHDKLGSTFVIHG